MKRQQLPAYSPLSGAALRRAALSGLRPGSDGRASVRSLLEREYAAEQALLFASGTQALQVGLQLALRQTAGAAVALPAFTCFAVASAAVGARARVHCYDVDPNTLGPDFASLGRLLERGVRVVVFSPLYGYPVDWDAVTELVGRYGAIAVEDAAQGDHAGWRGRPLGSLGPISVLSFGRGKGWAGGGGGALLVRDQGPWRGLRAALADVSNGQAGRRTDEARVVALLTAQWVLGRPGWYALPQGVPWLRLGETVYRDPVAPRPMTRAAASCLAALRPAAAREAAARHRTATAILTAIAARGRGVRAITPVAGATPGYLRLPLRLARGLAGFATARAARRLGLAPSYPSRLAEIPQLGPWLADESPQPGAEELVRTLWTAPTHSLLGTAECAELIALLQAYEGAG